MSEAEGHPGGATLVRAQIRRWAEELIDLSGRNRLINFRHTKSTTFEFDQGVETVLERLTSERRKPWRFARPEPPEFDDEGNPPPEWRPPAPAEDELVVISRLGKYRAEIDRGLKSLDSKARAEFLDTGLKVLYLGAGQLLWTDVDDKPLRSPLVMVPVLLRRMEGRDEYELRRDLDADWAINPALAEKLERDFDIELPTRDVDGLEDVVEFLADVEAALTDPAWSVEPAVVLAAFSFQKEVIYRDLMNNSAKIVEHPTVRLLAEGPGDFAADYSFSPVPENELDEVQPPEDTSLIMSADGTQRQCIQAARDGRSFVMDGPPGTGKSQTIANLIAQLLVDGKTVLFVSEKAAALEVVQNRLEADDVGLGSFLLPLHSHKATRKAVASALGEELGLAHHAEGGLSSVDRQRLLDDRLSLSGYAAAMNERREPLGRDVHWVVGRLAQLEQEEAHAAPARVNGAAHLDAERYALIIDAAGRLERAWAPVADGDEFIWRDLVNERPASIESRARHATEEHVHALGEARQKAELLSYRIDVPPPETESSALDLKALVEAFSATPDLAFAATEIGEGPAALRELAELVEESNRLSDQVDSRDLVASAVNDAWLRGLRSSTGTMAGVVPPVVAEPLTASTASAWQLAVQDLDATLVDVPAAEAVLRQAFCSTDRTLTLAELAELAELAKYTEQPNRPLAVWFQSGGFTQARSVLTGLGQHTEAVKTASATIADTYRPEVTTLDLMGLRARFRDLHRGVGKLKKQYRTDKATLGGATVLGKLTKEAIELLDEAIASKAAEESFEEYRVGARGWAGGYLGDDRVDFDGLRQAIVLAEGAAERIPEHADPVTVGRALAQPAASLAAIREAARTVEATLDRVQSTADAMRVDSQQLSDLTVEQMTEWASVLADACSDIARRLSDIGVESNVSVEGAVEFGECELARQAKSLQVEEFRSTVEPLGSVVHSHIDAPILEAADWLEALGRANIQPSSERSFEALRSLHGDAAGLATALEGYRRATDGLLTLFEGGSHRDGLKRDLDRSFDDGRELVEELRVTLPDIHTWTAFRAASLDLEAAGLREVVDELISRRIPTSAVAVSAEASLLEAWVQWIFDDDERLSPMRSTDRDELLARFRKADTSLASAAVAQVVNACSARRPKNNAGEAGFIQQQSQLKKKHKPIRTLFSQAGRAAQALKPCFMMSPMSVSQFLPPEMHFDVVIFDEASQVREADAIGAIYRGTQLIVAGDQKQLPPTSFFQRTREEDEDPFGEGEELDLPEFESVLDRCKAQGFESLPLRWHYRSRHEDLITFSNRSFYYPQMHTFPGALHSAPDLGVEFFRVNGVYQRGGMRDNRIEADAVVDRVLFHLRNHPEQDLGVVTLSSAQASAVEFAIEERATVEPELRGLTMDDRLKGFFVKNLENVQGDERDIIIFSVGYGPDEFGKFTMNFGPMNKPGGERRLNVAVTRARRKVEVIASFDPAQMETSNPTLRHFARYLDYAQRGLVALAVDEVLDSVAEPDSPFEEEVAAAVRAIGYDVVPQVGVAGYRVDIGVKHPTDKGRYVLGIECDGASYHSSKVARDRDRLRQEVLEGLDWVIHRVWSTAWFTQRDQEIERIRLAIETALNGGRPQPAAQQSAAVTVSSSEVDFDAPPAWAESWTEPAVPHLGAAEDFTSPLARNDIADRIVHLAKTCGPIHREAVLRALRVAFGLGRAGSRIREAFDGIVAGLETRGLVEDQDGFIRTPGQVIRVRVPMGPEDPVRPVSEVSPDELELALIRLLDDSGASIGGDELKIRCARLFGWDRLGPEIERTLNELLDG